MFTDASNEGWDTHLGDSTAKGARSIPERLFGGLKEFEPLCKGQVVCS